MLRNNKLTDQYNTQQQRATLTTVGASNDHIIAVSSKSTIGNDITGIQQFQVQQRYLLQPPAPASNDERFGLGIIAGIGAGAAFVFVSFILLGVYLCCHRKNNNHTNNSHDSRDTKNTSVSLPNGTTSDGITGGAIILTSNSTHNNNNNSSALVGNTGGGLTPKEKKTFMKLEDDINRRCTKKNGKTINLFSPNKKKEQQSDPSGTNNNGFLRVWDNTNPTTSTTLTNKGNGKLQTKTQTKSTKNSKTKSIVQKDDHRQPSNSTSRDQRRDRYQQQSSSSNKRTGIMDDNDSLWGLGGAANDDDVTMYTERDENGIPRGKYGQQKQQQQGKQNQQRTISRNSNPSFGFSSSRLMMISNENNNNDNDSLISGIDTNGNYQSSNRSMMTYAYSLEAGNIDDNNTTQHDAAIGGGTLTSDGEYYHCDHDSNASFGAFSNANNHRDMIEVSQDDGSSISIGGDGNGNDDLTDTGGDTTDDDGTSSYDTRQLPQDDNDNDNNNNDPTTTLPTNMIRRSILVPAGKLGIVIDTTANGPVVFHVNPNSVVLNKVFPGDVFIGLNNINTRHMSAIAITELVLKTNNQPRTLTVLSTVK